MHSYVHYVRWENVDEFMRLGWELVGSMGVHRDYYGVLMVWTGVEPPPIRGDVIDSR